MKTFKLVSLFLAGLLIAPVAFAYDAPTVSGWTNKSQNAQANKQSTPVRVLKFVRNPRNSSAGVSQIAGMSSGDAVIYDTVSDDGVTINVTTVSGDARFCGILATAIPTSDNNTATSAFDDVGGRNWGWVTVDGPADATNAGTNGASAGDLFITSTDAGRISGISGTAEPPARSANRGGFYMDAPTTGGTVEVFVRSN